jgi:hypothetical protein
VTKCRPVQIYGYFVKFCRLNQQVLLKRRWTWQTTRRQNPTPQQTAQSRIWETEISSMSVSRPFFQARIAGLNPRSPRHFVPHKLSDPPTSGTWLPQYRHHHRLDCRNTLTYAHTTLAHSPVCLGSLTLSTSQAGGFMELILLHLTAIMHYSPITRSLAKSLNSLSYFCSSYEDSCFNDLK